MKNEEWRMENGEWRMESGEWRMENGEWRVESGEWRMENGEWRVESGEWSRVKRLSRLAIVIGEWGFRRKKEKKKKCWNRVASRKGLRPARS